MVSAAVYAPRAGVGGGVIVWGWAGVVAASTLLTHQHHVADVLAGWLLGVAGKRLIYDRRADLWPRRSVTAN